MLASEMLEFADGLRTALHTVEELESSLPAQTGTKSNGITSLHFLCPFLQELWSYAYFNVGRNVGICRTFRTPEYYIFAVIASPPWHEHKSVPLRCLAE